MRVAAGTSAYFLSLQWQTDLPVAAQPQEEDEDDEPQQSQLLLFTFLR